MKTEVQIKQELGVIENEIQQNADYEEKEFASDIIRAYARWYENNVPTSKLSFPFAFKNSLVGNDPYLIRLQNAFTAANQIFDYNFI